MKNLHNMSRLPENVIADTTHDPSENFMHAKHTLEPFHEEIDSEAPRRRDKGLQSLFVGVLYPGYRGMSVMAQKLGYDQFPPAAHG
jgi:hypothetical protein